VKVRDRKRPLNRRWISGLTDKITHSFFESPDTRTGAEAPVLSHQQKLPINSCFGDENASQSQSLPLEPAAFETIPREWAHQQRLLKMWCSN
jgi:hypothetical protein